MLPPYVACWDRLDDVPVLGDFAVLDAEQVVERCGRTVEFAFAGEEDEVAFAEHMVDVVVLRGDACFRPGLECCLEV